MISSLEIDHQTSCIHPRDHNNDIYTHNKLHIAYHRLQTTDYDITITAPWHGNVLLVRLSDGICNVCAAPLSRLSTILPGSPD